MSVINKMLQDLENRHSTGAADSSMSAHLRAVPARSQIHPAWWVIVLLTLLAVTSLVVWKMWPSPKVADPLLPVQTVTGELAQIKTDQHVLTGHPSSAASVSIQHPSTDLKLAMQLSAVQDLAAAQLQTMEKKSSPEAAAPAVIKPQPVVPAPVAANAAPSHIIPNVGKPIAALPAQAQVIPVSDERVDSRPNVTAAATPVLKQIKEITPQQRAENEYGKAVSLMQQGRTTEAIESLGNVLQFDPGNTAARQTLVGLLVAAKRYGDAERSLQDGLKLNPGQTGLAMIMARLQVEQGNTQNALKTLQRSLPFAAEQPDYQAFLAALLQREGRNKEAVEHYVLALRKVPGSGVWLMGMGISLQAENHQAEAQEAFLRAKASNSLSPELLAFVEQQLKQSKQH
ncbi:MAG: tetratricopeptide repeat protein [Sulfuriferula sp.]